MPRVDVLCCFQKKANSFNHSLMKEFEFGEAMASDLRTIVWNRSIDLDLAASWCGEEFLSSSRQNLSLFTALWQFIVKATWLARPHTTFISRQLLERQCFSILHWPALSPDLIPMDHVWDMLRKAIQLWTDRWTMLWTEHRSHWMLEWITRGKKASAC